MAELTATVETAEHGITMTIETDDGNTVSEESLAWADVISEGPDMWGQFSEIDVNTETASVRVNADRGPEFDAIEMPAIDACPECGSTHMEGMLVSVKDCSIALDGNGGILDTNKDMLYETRLRQLDCFDCGAILIEDAEIVHPDIK